MTTFIFIVLLIGIIFWVVNSYKVVGPAQVGVKLYFGKPVEVRQSGRVFLPWIPFKFSGLRPWELMRIPKKMYCLVYNGGEDRMAMTEDKQMLRYEVTAYIRFPYADSESMIKVVENGVPLTDKGLKDWAETVILAFVRDVIAEYGYEECLGKDQLEIMNKAVNDKFGKDDKSLFCSTGVCGVNPADPTAGSGEVRIKIEKISPSLELQRKLESVETAGLDAKAAENLAKVVAIQSGGPINLLMDQWIKAMAKRLGYTVEETTKKAHENGTWNQQLRLYKDMILANSDDLTVIRNELGSPDGGPLPASLQYIAVNGGGGVGVMANGRRDNKNNRGNRDGGGQGGEQEKPAGQPSPNWIKRNGGKSS